MRKILLLKIIFGITEVFVIDVDGLLIQAIVLLFLLMVFIFMEIMEKYTNQLYK